MSQPYALIVDDPAGAAPYVESVLDRVGLRWALVANLELFEYLLAVEEVPVGVVLLDFRSVLTEKLKYYLAVVRHDVGREIPVVLLPDETTRAQAERLVERPCDCVLVRPVDGNTLEHTLAELMRSSERRAVELPVRLHLAERVVEGRTVDVSASGAAIEVDQPVLFPTIEVELLVPERGLAVRLGAEIRRKHRLGSGHWRLGVRFERLVSGDLVAFAAATGVRLALDAET